MTQPSWSRYLEHYHRAHPGVTETAFAHASDDVLGSPYEWLAAALPAHLGDVLDVACGNAAMQPRLTGTTSYLGVDLSEAELAAARAAGRGPVIRGDARALPVPGASVDTVVCAMGLMLVTPAAAAVQEMARVLRHGGTAGLLLPAVLPLHLSDLRPLATLSVHLRGPGSTPQRVSRGRLARMLGTAGLTMTHSARHRFAFPLVTREHAGLAVRSLYTPGRAAGRLAAAEAALADLAGPGRHLPVPLLRVVARKGP